MKNLVKVIAKTMTNSAFTIFSHYQPKMPDSLMEKAQAKNKKED